MQPVALKRYIIDQPTAVESCQPLMQSYTGNQTMTQCFGDIQPLEQEVLLANIATQHELKVQNKLSIGHQEKVER